MSLIICGKNKRTPPRNITCLRLFASCARCNIASRQHGEFSIKFHNIKIFLLYFTKREPIALDDDDTTQTDRSFANWTNLCSHTILGAKSQTMTICVLHIYSRCMKFENRHRALWTMFPHVKAIVIHWPLIFPTSGRMKCCANATAIYKIKFNIYQWFLDTMLPIEYVKCEFMCK